jgi:hypothetical protein
MPVAGDLTRIVAEAIEQARHTCGGISYGRLLAGHLAQRRFGERARSLCAGETAANRLALRRFVRDWRTRGPVRNRLVSNAGAVGEEAIHLAADELLARALPVSRKLLGIAFQLAVYADACELLASDTSR